MKTETSFDAVIVGAGPAGSIAAYEIARAGCSVLLIEKHPIIGVPVCCGEAITVEGLTQVLPLDPRWAAAEINGALLVGPAGRQVHFVHPEAGYVLDRKVVDRDLADRAAKAGATVWVNTEATGLESDDGKNFNRVLLNKDGTDLRVGCRVVLGCDGVESLVGRWAGLDTVITPDALDAAAQYLLDDLDNITPGCIEFHYSQTMTPGGYAWVFPKGPSTANVGLGLTPSLSSGASPTERLDEFVTRRFGTVTIREKTGGGVPAFRGRKLMLKKNVLLAGDAARLLDSLSGAGIGNALLSGQLAGQTAAEYLQSVNPRPSMLKKYPERFMRRKGRQLRYLLYARHIFMRMTDGDLDNVVDFLRPLYHQKTLYSVDAIVLIKQVLRGHPKLLTLARHLIW